jgi:hypothetical protein
MNQRIKELLKQATRQVDREDREWVFSEVDQAKFAELIVEECARRCDFVRENNGGDRQFGARLCADEIRSMNRRS